MKKTLPLGLSEPVLRHGWTWKGFVDQDLKIHNLIKSKAFRGASTDVPGQPRGYWAFLCSSGFRKIQLNFPF